MTTARVHTHTRVRARSRWTFVEKFFFFFFVLNTNSNTRTRNNNDNNNVTRCRYVADGPILYRCTTSRTRALSTAVFFPITRSNNIIHYFYIFSFASGNSFRVRITSMENFTLALAPTIESIQNIVIRVLCIIILCLHAGPIVTHWYIHHKQLDNRREESCFQIHNDGLTYYVQLKLNLYYMHRYMT